jgi:hypothetical protein
MSRLELYGEYDRKDAHAIFSPNTEFVPQAGTWGLQGIVRVPDRQGDWVFFVTFGQEQGEHVFDESITEDGVLSWQSQPSQGFSSPVIHEFINHDDRVNNIYLFLRSKRSPTPYTYLGRLGYLTHDSVREKPVHFQWQLLDWDESKSIEHRIGLVLLKVEKDNSPEIDAAPTNTLILQDKPQPKRSRAGVTTAMFRAKKAPDYAARDERNRDLGLKGELLVLAYETQRLVDAGRADLAKMITHVSVAEGDSAGYDIRSYASNGDIQYVEVKTTRGPASTSFFMSPNELAFSASNKDSYYLFRLFEFNAEQNVAKTFILQGDASKSLVLTPTVYRADLLADR